MKFNITKKCMHILTALESAGFQAYIIGGCVRDMIMGREVHDFDITTNALPQQIIDTFPGEKVIATGIKHGTVTVLYENEPFEITTFRIDGEYSDSRRPDSVEFTSSLKEDASRRDFTMNAIAVDSNGNVFDYFNGVSDIENHIIRCVGDPEKRFTEDALRILRAVRFASVLGFEIDSRTAESAVALKERLEFVSAERIRSELVKLICGINSADIMLKYREIIGQIIPEMRVCFDFSQHSPYHKYDVYEHIVRAVDNIPTGLPDTEILRTALLFHDIGKPQTFKPDTNGRGHFKGHAGVSADMAEKIMRRLKFDNKTIETVCTIVAMHGDTFDFGGSDRKNMPVNEIKHMISKIGADNFFLLLKLKKADNSAKNDFVLDENNEIDKIAETARRLISENCCMSLAQLAINGNDLKSLGFSGRAIGDCLARLLDMVMDGRLENNHHQLIDYAKEMLEK
ncbi:MAG: HD domain-containing protein [Ruminococcus flavefaciens]|nr:HD domain-containing protein [Ruminococcus flavefaciens]MCM1230518.1 HD domain-containing protein [Ruminococcus flavefaciens]